MGRGSRRRRVRSGPAVAAGNGAVGEVGRPRRRSGAALCPRGRALLGLGVSRCPLRGLSPRLQPVGAGGDPGPGRVKPVSGEGGGGSQKDSLKRELKNGGFTVRYRISCFSGCLCVVSESRVLMDASPSPQLAELKQECLARGLEAKGNKQDLINRLQAYLEEHGGFPGPCGVRVLAFPPPPWALSVLSVVREPPGFGFCVGVPIGSALLRHCFSAPCFINGALAEKPKVSLSYLYRRLICCFSSLAEEEANEEDVLGEEIEVELRAGLLCWRRAASGWLCWALLGESSAVSSSSAGALLCLKHCWALLLDLNRFWCWRVSAAVFAWRMYECMVVVWGGFWEGLWSWYTAAVSQGGMLPLFSAGCCSVSVGVCCVLSKESLTPNWVP